MRKRHQNLSNCGQFKSSYPLQVLHRMRVRSLRAGLGRDIRKTFLVKLSETKLAIAIRWMQSLQDDIESGLLLPISQVKSKSPTNSRWTRSSPLQATMESRSPLCLASKLPRYWSQIRHQRRKLSRLRTTRCYRYLFQTLLRCLLVRDDSNCNSIWFCLWIHCWSPCSKSLVQLSTMSSLD